MPTHTPTDDTTSSPSDSSAASRPASSDNRQERWHYWPTFGTVIAGMVIFLALLVAFVAPAAARAGPEAICTTDLADTIRNIFLLIQFGGPLVGGVVGTGAMVIKPYLRGEDMKRQAKQLRDGAFLWGVVAAPLAMTMVQFLLNNVVAGGSTCGF